MLSSSFERLAGFFFWGPMNGMGWFCCIVPVVLVVLLVNMLGWVIWFMAGKEE